METVASSLYCFLKTTKNFESSVVSAVIGGNDADTTGAITGAISGAYNGIEGIPKRWIENVEDSELII